MNSNKKYDKVNYLKIAIYSVMIVIFLCILLLAFLYYSKILNWDEIVPLGSNIVGGIIGCIGTMAAVMLTAYQTNKIQDDNKESEFNNTAYNNMPIFVVGRSKMVAPIVPFKRAERKGDTEIEKNILMINFVLKNISLHSVKINSFKIVAYSNSKYLQGLYPGDNIDLYAINSKLREDSKIKIGEKDYNYNSPLVAEKEERNVKVALDIDKDLLGFEGDIYVHIILDYFNIVGQNFNQELIIITSSSIQKNQMIYCGEEMPVLIRNKT